MKNGRLLCSDCWHGFQPTDTVHVMSVTKSIVSLLIGIALDHGLIRSVNQPVLDFFPDYTIKRSEKTIQHVTLKHLLTMTAPYKYRHEPWTKICTSETGYQHCRLWFVYFRKGYGKARHGGGSKRYLQAPYF